MYFFSCCVSIAAIYICRLTQYTQDSVTTTVQYDQTQTNADDFAYIRLLVLLNIFYWLLDPWAIVCQ